MLALEKTYYATHPVMMNGAVLQVDQPGSVIPRHSYGQPIEHAS